MPHYGRYVTLEKNARIATTWVSPATHGDESRLEITLAEKDRGKTELVLERAELARRRRRPRPRARMERLLGRIAETLATR